MSTKMIAREQRRLGVVFRRAMLVAVAGIGCSTKGADAVATLEEAGVDSGVVEAGVDAAAPDAAKEAGPPDPCQASRYTPNPPDTCGDFIKYPCGLPTGLTARGDCFFAINDCAALCPDIHYSCRAADGYCSDAGPDAGDTPGTVVPDEAGAVLIDCSLCPGSAGRVPEGLEPATVSARSALGAYFASAARLEAASVTSFRRLREELSAAGAPEELLEGAKAAEHDEVRHTRSMARLARRHGGRYVRPRVAPVAPRSLAIVAEENAVEGCARETFGALVATWQAAHVDDADVAHTLARIAEDETRHAALSWAVARWSLTKLDAGAAERMGAAWSAALDGMVAGPADAGFERAAGLPSLEERRRLAGELRGLWSELAGAA